LALSFTETLVGSDFWKLIFSGDISIWTLEIRQAWVDALTTITAMMLNGAGENYPPLETV